MPFFRDHEDLQFFQQGNARAHGARATRAFLLKQELTLMDWPAFHGKIRRRLYYRN